MNNNQIILAGGNNILIADEIKAEDNYIYSLTVKKSAVCKTKESIGLFNSLTKQISSWFKSLSFDTKVERSLLTNINSSVDEFINYVTIKLKKNKVLLEKYNILFSKPECIEEIKALFFDNIYKLKFELKILNNPNIPGFYSINAFFIYCFHVIKKECKSTIFEAVVSSGKLSENLNPEQLEKFIELASELIENKLTKRIEEITVKLFGSYGFKLFTKENKELEGGDTNG